jgi:hypothetical protein
MKTLLIICGVLMTVSSYGQLTNQERLLYEQKVESYKGMKQTGKGLAMFGFLAGVTGAVLFNSGKNKLESGNINDLSSGTSQYSIGTTLGICGVTAMAAGIILSNNGSRKMKEYQQRLDLGIIYNKQVKGLTLAYRF